MRAHALACLRACSYFRLPAAEWFNKKGLSAKEISDEITRRWSEGPTPSAQAAPTLLPGGCVAHSLACPAGQASLNALLRRVQTAEEAKLAAKAVERCGAACCVLHERHTLTARLLRPRSFHGQRCEAGWLTGVGAVSSAEFARACTRTGAVDVAVAMFARAPLVGLSVTPDVCCRLLASTADKVRRLGRPYQLPRPADTSLRAPGRGHDA